MARSTSAAPTMPAATSEPERWLLGEEDVPESSLHRRIVTLLVAVLTAWIARNKLDAQVESNLALRWDPTRPRTGADPDVLLMQPVPPEGHDLTCFDLWQSGHAPPRVVVEVVSLDTAEKDYLDAPTRYEAAGVNELWIFDPKGFGPAVPDGPYVLQVLRRTPTGKLDWVYKGDGPAFSPGLGAWLVVTDGEMLRLADDREGTRLWPTGEEEERAARERAERDRDQERTARKNAERAFRQRIEELERLLAERQGR